MNKGLLTLLLLFTCFAHAQVVDTWQFANPQQQQQALNIASQLRCPQCQNQNNAGHAKTGNLSKPVSGK